MISIYCDEDVDIIIKPLLEAKGFKVTITLDEKILRASDNQQVNHAIKIGHVFLTHNRVHYELLREATKRQRTGQSITQSPDGKSWKVLILSLLVNIPIQTEVESYNLTYISLDFGI